MKTQANVIALQHETELQHKAISKLQQTLEEFTEAKYEHEHKLLEKFRYLLNSKKMKIRDQQRLLAGAKLDTTTAKGITNSRAIRATSKDVAPRGFKCKAREDSDDEDMEGLRTPESSRHEGTDDDVEAFEEPTRATVRKPQPTSEPEPSRASINSDEEETDDEL